MINIYKKLKHNFLVNFFLLLLIQIILENAIQLLFNEEAIQISISFLFIINLLMFILIKKKYVFFLIQIIIVSLYIIILLPHLYYFNLFSFYTRINYLFYDPLKFIYYLSILAFGMYLLFLISKLQLLHLNNIIHKKSYILILLLIALSFKIIYNPIKFTIKKNKFIVTVINQNKFLLFKKDYQEFKIGEYKIQNYQCIENKNLSPTIRFMYNSHSKKELLLIVESWGVLKDNQMQKEFIRTILSSLSRNKAINYKYGETCFNGNTSAAEGRELLNMNNEESYRAFLDKGVIPQFNIVKYKNKHNYYTVAAFSGSKVYGSNWSNSEGFRRKLGFKSRFYFEELKNINNINHENNYHSVNDEIMIDSLFTQSKIHQNIFAYGLTINTHKPFELDISKLELKKYKKFKDKYSYFFKDSPKDLNQLYRIKEIIEHTLTKLDTSINSFDKILIIGDHAPANTNLNFYNKENVPFLLIKKINYL